MGERHAWHARRKETLERLRAAGEEIGRAALESFGQDEKRGHAVQSGLLDVAAHAAPEETRPILVELTTTYGADLGLRKNAVLLLGETAPELAVEILEPIIVATRRAVTYPPDEQMIEAWITASRKLGHDQGPTLARIVTDPNQSQEARHWAAKGLGEFESAIGLQALDRMIVESAGNNYLRRLCAQSLQKIMPREDFCARMEEIIQLEADQNFQLFLDSMLDKNCR